MEVIRKPFQGVTNIIRFNWHFYVIAGSMLILLFSSMIYISEAFSWIVYTASILIFFTTFISLAVSCYVYDYSGLYKFEWLKHLSISDDSKIININAGFDETSSILKGRFLKVDLKVFDFYDSKKHTEVSIKRARKAYGPFPGTKQISTSLIPVEDNSVNFILNIFAIHEVRDRRERVNFLKKQLEVLKSDGRCIVVEHLRDLPNFVAYNIGFLHFFSLNEWDANFSVAGFQIEKVLKITPFVSVFILKKNNGTTP